MSQKRIYEDGRSTEGWLRGTKLKDVKEAKVGKVLIVVNHTFKTENLCKVLPTQDSLLPKFTYQFCARDGSVMPNENVLTVMSHDLSHGKVEEWYIAEKDKNAPKPPKAKPNATPASLPTPIANDTPANSVPAPVANATPAEVTTPAPQPASKPTKKKGTKKKAAAK